MDVFTRSISVKGEDASRHAVEEAFGVFTIGDGLSGHNGADASNFATDLVLRGLLQRKERILQEGDAYLKQEIAGLLAAANEQLHPNKGTTLDVLVVDGNTAHLAHIGDGRVYRASATGVEQITKDETDDPDHLRPSVGPANFLGKEAGLTLEQYHVFPIEQVRYLLLTTDGLFTGVTQTEIARAVMQGKHPLEVLDELEKRLQNPEERLQVLMENKVEFQRVIVRMVAQPNWYGSEIEEARRLVHEGTRIVDPVVRYMRSNGEFGAALREALTPLIVRDDTTLMLVDFSDATRRLLREVGRKEAEGEAHESASRIAYAAIVGEPVTGTPAERASAIIRAHGERVDRLSADLERTEREKQTALRQAEETYQQQLGAQQGTANQTVEEERGRFEAERARFQKERGEAERRIETAQEELRKERDLTTTLRQLVTTAHNGIARIFSYITRRDVAPEVVETDLQTYVTRIEQGHDSAIQTAKEPLETKVGKLTETIEAEREKTQKAETARERLQEKLTAINTTITTVADRVTAEYNGLLNRGEELAASETVEKNLGWYVQELITRTNERRTLLEKDLEETSKDAEAQKRTVEAHQKTIDGLVVHLTSLYVRITGETAADKDVRENPGKYVEEMIKKRDDLQNDVENQSSRIRKLLEKVGDIYEAITGRAEAIEFTQEGEERYVRDILGRVAGLKQRIQLPELPKQDALLKRFRQSPIAAATAAMLLFAGIGSGLWYAIPRYEQPEAVVAQAEENPKRNEYQEKITELCGRYNSAVRTNLAPRECTSPVFNKTALDGLVAKEAAVRVGLVQGTQIARFFGDTTGKKAVYCIDEHEGKAKAVFSDGSPLIADYPNCSVFEQIYSLQEATIDDRMAGSDMSVLFGHALQRMRYLVVNGVVYEKEANGKVRGLADKKSVELKKGDRVRYMLAEAPFLQVVTTETLRYVAGLDNDGSIKLSDDAQKRDPAELFLASCVEFHSDQEVRMGARIKKQQNIPETEYLAYEGNVIKRVLIQNLTGVKRVRFVQCPPHLEHEQPVTPPPAPETPVVEERGTTIPQTPPKPAKEERLNLTGKPLKGYYGGDKNICYLDKSTGGMVFWYQKQDWYPVGMGYFFGEKMRKPDDKTRIACGVFLEQLVVEGVVTICRDAKSGKGEKEGVEIQIPPGNIYGLQDGGVYLLDRTNGVAIVRYDKTEMIPNAQSYDCRVGKSQPAQPVHAPRGGAPLEGIIKIGDHFGMCVYLIEQTGAYALDQKGQRKLAFIPKETMGLCEVRKTCEIVDGWVTDGISPEYKTSGSLPCPNNVSINTASELK